MSGGGDIDGDGFSDLLIGAPFSQSGIQAGFAWVVFGASVSPAFEELGTRVAAGTAYRIQGEATGDNAAYDVCNAGDVNGDGFDDFLLSAIRADSEWFPTCR